MKRTPTQSSRIKKRERKRPHVKFSTEQYSSDRAVITTDRDGCVQGMNALAEHLTGWNEAEARGRQIRAVFHPIIEADKGAASPVKQVLDRKEPVQFDDRAILKSRDGSEIPITGTAAPILHHTKKVAGVVLSFRRKDSAQDVAREALELAENIVETMKNPFLILDEKLEIVAANRSFYRMFDLAAHQTIGAKIHELGDRKWDIPHLRALLNDILPHGKSFDDYEVELRLGNGEKRTMFLSARRLQRARGRSGLIFLTIEDITERKEAEQARRDSDERFSHISRLITDYAYAFVVGPDGTMRGEWVTDSFTKAFGYTLPKIQARGGWQTIVHPADLAIALGHARKVVAGQPDVCEMRFITREGAPRWLRDVALPVWDETRTRVVKIYGASEDITERKQAEEALHEREEQFRSLAESALTGSYLFQDNVFQYVNPALERIFGYEPGSIVRKIGPMDLTHPDDREMVRRNISKREQGKVHDIRYEFRGIKKDGAIIFVEVHGARLDYKGKPAIMGTLVDITERKRAEERTRQLNRVYAILSEVNQAVVRLKNPQQLFDEACHIAVQKGGFQFAWIGTLNATAGHISPAAHAGINDGYLEKLALDLTDPGNHQSPAMIVLRTGSRFVSNDIENDPHIGPWRAAALQRGYRAAIALPLTVNGKTIGTFSLYAGAPGYFTDEELYLLDELALDISFALEAYQREIERKKAEEALREQEIQYRTLFEAAPVGIGVADREGNLIIFNQAMLKQGGYTVADIRALGNVASLYHDPAQRLEALSLLQEKGFVHQFPVRFKRKDGTPYHALLTLTPVSIQGKPCVQALVEDITAHKRAEEALAASESELRALFAAMRDIVLVFDRDGVCQRIAPTSPDLLYKPPDELLGKPFRDIFPSEQANQFHRAILHALDSQQTTLIEYQLPIRGRNLWFSTSVSPMNENEALCVARDVTEWKRTTEQIGMLAHALRSIDECVSITDLNDTLLFVNNAFLKTYGYEEEELLGKHISVLRSPDVSPVVYNQIRPATIKGGWRGELVNRRKDGTDFPTFLSTSLVKDDNDNPIALIGVASDISERKKAEKALRESEERYRKFFEEDLTADYIVTRDGQVVTCNPAYVKLFGFASVEEALGTNTAQQWPSPEKRMEMLARLKSERTLKYHPLELRRRDGRPVHVIANIIGLYDAGGELQQIQAYLFDDTPRKLLEEQLRQAQKMESLGTLAGGIAHDFNNILGIILGHSSMLEQVSTNPQKLSQTSDAINKATQRGASLVKQLLTFARKTDSVFESVLVNEIIQEVVKLIRGTFPKTIEIETTIPPMVPPIVADATQIHQVLLNLCVNARDAMPKGGTLSIVCSTIPADQLRHTFPKATSTEYLCIEVADTGVGMDQTVLQRIFDPFFTTKGPGKGTGLGLALVYGIVEAHRGHIEVSSHVGRGTVFHIFLPLDERFAVLEGRPQRLLADIPGGTETILLVEDESMLRDLAHNVLLSKGYTVMTARDGEEGVALFVENRQKIDLVVCDLGLPKLGGEEVVRRICEVRPTVKVVIASGFIDPAIKVELTKDGVHHFIQKPYRPEALLMTVRGALDAPQ